MSNQRTRKMVSLKVLETSGVDHPAHLEEGWIVMKSAQGASMENEEVGMDEGLEEAYIERVIELEKALSASQAQFEELQKAKMTAPEDEDEDEDEADAMYAKGKKGMMKSESEEEMIKSLPEPVRQMLAKAQSDTDVAKAELRKEREERQDLEYVAKVAEWSHLTIDASEVGPALRRLAEFDAPLMDNISKALDAANAQAESANIFEELGRSNAPSLSGAYGKVQSLAKSAHEKGDYATMEQAVAAVVQNNPDLYAEYRAENQ